MRPAGVSGLISGLGGCGMGVLGVEMFGEGGDVPWKFVSFFFPEPGGRPTETNKKETAIIHK